MLSGKGASVIRASVDCFHNPREIRYRRGRDSPEGFFWDSYDYEQLTSLLLDPLGSGGNKGYVRRVYDIEKEAPVPLIMEQALPQAILVIDGIFLHRDELVSYWDYSVWLEVPFEVSIPRGALRGSGDPDPKAPSNQRYVEGQRLYLEQCRPMDRASVVIDNTDLGRPVVR